MTKKRRILVDIDGITADNMPAWLLRIYERTGILALMSDLTSWEIHKCPPLNQLREEQIFDILNEPGFTFGLPPLGGAVANLKLLQEAKNEIYFVTARFGPVGMPETVSWVRRHFPWMNPTRQLVFAHDKSIIDADVLIDDRPENLLAYKAVHPKAHLITIDYPYNQMDIPGLFRVPYNNPGVWTNIRNYIEFLDQVEKNAYLH